MSNKPLSVDQTLIKAKSLAKKGAPDQAMQLYQAVLKRFPGNKRAIEGLKSLTRPKHNQRQSVLDIEPSQEQIDGLIALYNRGRLQEALEQGTALAGRDPSVPLIWNILGAVNAGLGRLDQAVASYTKALQIKPDYAKAHNNLGIALNDLGKHEEAIASYYKALAIKPDFTVVYHNLTEVLEKTNRTEALREAVNKAKRSCPGSLRLALSEAQLLKRDGDYAAARAVLEGAWEPVADTDVMAARAFLLGDLCDRLGDVEAAYDYFSQGNRLRRDTPRAMQADGGRCSSQIDVLAKRFTVNWIADWQPLECGDARPDPVFLVGFPRSGTTLLDTILRSHAAISVVEEAPTVGNVRKVLGRLPGGYPDGLAELDSDHLAELRRTYFVELDKHLDPEGRSPLVVDKLPLNTIDAGLIHRIFPQARFLFVKRHPCDCVLSCFMQNFKPTDAMVNFFDLAGAARFYDQVMTLWQQYRAVLPLKVHTVRYETLVEAFEETVAPVFDFLDVGWDDGVQNYVETALLRGRIKTPSYNQVTQPLYTRARGRWKRYRKHLQPVLPILLPWARHFGYRE